jgi:hypothetical protein
MRQGVTDAALAALARPRRSSYQEQGRSAADLSLPLVRSAGWDGRMVHPISTQNATMPAHGWNGGGRPAVVIAVALVCTGLLAGASLLWMHYGTAVFFEMITSGIAACV